MKAGLEAGRLVEEVCSTPIAGAMLSFGAAVWLLSRMSALIGGIPEGDEPSWLI